MNVATASGPASAGELHSSARIGTWPNDPAVAHLVLLDHQTVPSAALVERWVATARNRGARAIRTGALFPEAMPAFLAAGFRTIDTLALLTCDLRSGARSDATRRRSRTRPLRARRLDAASDVDRRAFGDLWGNDAGTLAEVQLATPTHRSRAVVRRGRHVAFVISGLAGRTGYLQRLAVDPDEQRCGHGRALVDDALAWMRRRGATTAMVNTADGNAAAMALYESVGFSRREQDLSILELSFGAGPHRGAAHSC